MAFPADALDLTVQLHYSSAWQDITSDVFGRDAEPVRVTNRGRSAEGARSDHTRMTMDVNNGTSKIDPSVVGRYSPRNPSSDLYGLIGRNTPIRAYTGTAHLGAGGGSSTAATSHVAPSVTATAAGIVISGWLAATTGNYLAPGTPVPETDGLFSTCRTSYDTVAGAGATGTRSATFSSSQAYVSASAVLHGSSITVAETLTSVDTTIEDVTLTTGAGTAVGDWLVAVQGWARGVDTVMPGSPAGDHGGWILLADSSIELAALTLYMRIWARRVSVAGAQSVIYQGLPEGHGIGNADNHAVLYRLSGVSDWDVRATCEVPAWPPRWDISGTDVWVPVEAAGILRRLGQGASPLRSPLRRALSGATVTRQAGVSLLPVAYWPLEDTGDSTVAASGLAGGAPMHVTGGSVEWAAVSSAGSASLPDWRQSTGTLNGPVTGVTGDWGVGALVQYTSTDSWICWSVHQITGGPYVRLQVTAGSSVSVTAYTDSGSSTLLTEAQDLSDGLPHYVEVQAIDGGASVTYNLRIDGSTVDQAVVGTTAGPGSPAVVRVHPRASGDAATVGHVGVWSTPVTGTWTYLVGPALDGHVGEVAGRRIQRLCAEQGVTLHVVGDLDDTAAMGAQGVGTLLDLIREAETADGGILYEPRTALGLAYRCRSARYNLPVTLGLDYSAGELAPPLEPTDDDRYVRNDVTVSRQGGSSAPYEVTTGALSTLDPPDGVGRYDEAVSINVQSDSQLPDQASWRAHLGTVDEARWPSITVDLAALGAASKSTLARTAAAVDVGDRLTISNPPAWLPPDLIDQQAEGTTEVLGQYTRQISYVGVPASPWTVGVVGDDELGRADTAGSVLHAAYVAGTDTSMSVRVTDGPLWIDSTDHAAMLPMELRTGGVTVEVTGVTAPVSPTFQTGTADHDDNASLTPTLPASISDGDILFMLAAIRSTSATPDTPTGWERLPVFDVDDNVQLFGLVASGTVSAPTVTFTGGSAGDSTSARIVRFRSGQYSTASAAVWRAHAQLNASAQDIAYPQMRTATPRCLVLYLGWKQDDWTGVATISGASEVMDDSTTLGSDQGIVMDRVVLTTETTIPAGSFSVTGGAAAISRGAVVVIRDDVQTMTVTQATVNGVARTVPAGSAVSLATPWVAAL